MILGIDVSKDKLDVYISTRKQDHTIKNSEASIKSFMKNKVGQISSISLVVFESTGGLEKRLQAYLIKEKIPYHRAHPNRVYCFGQSEGAFAKTDRIDARLLARYAERKQLSADEETSQAQLEMQEFSSRKQQLKAQLLQENNRLSQPYLNKLMSRSIKRIIKLLTKELELISSALESKLSEAQSLVEKQKLLQTVKGVGKEVASLLITDLPELGQLSREAISLLVGVAPRAKDSGKKQGYRAISQGRSNIRKALYMSALVASRYNPRMKQIYNKLLLKGKPKKVALVAIMRKMIIMMNAMVKNNTAWRCEEI